MQFMDLRAVGVQFKEARRQSGQSQQSLAASLGMSRATVSALERGRPMEIGVLKLSALLNAVGLDMFVGPRRGRPTLDDLRAERRGKPVH
jgi:transcriptional regulator with XRE-family HTH domain